MPPAPDWGIFTLGNDAVIGWLLPLFESLRRHAPDLPVRLIPFDDRLDRTLRLLEVYGAELFQPSSLSDWDRIGETFYSENVFHARGFRKLAAFEGSFERFIFCDSDVVLLAPLEELIAAAERRPTDLVHFDTDPDQVYRQGPLRDRMAAQGFATGFNCGLFGGRRRALTLSQFRSLATTWAASWREVLVENAEQPFVNLQADLAGASRCGLWELLPGHCSTAWPAVGEFRQENGVWRLRGSNRWDEGWRLLFAHWGGFRLEGDLPNRHVHEEFRQSGSLRLAELGVTL